MSRALCLLSTACILVASVFAVPVRAQEPDPRDTEARRLFEAGESAFSDGRYEDALERFRDAHELSHRPRLLYNIATAAERLRRDREALEAYEAYLAALPDAHNRREVEARIRILQETLATTDASAAPAEGTDAAPAEGTEGGSAGDYPLTWLFASGTVVATILGVTGRLLGNSEYDDLVDRCTRIGGCTDEEVEGSSVKRWDRLTVTSFGLAAALLVATVIAFPLERPSAGDEPALSLELGPTSAVLRGSF